MFEALLAGTAAVIIIAMLSAYDGSLDLFHPLVFIGPMMLFLYVWMPARLYLAGHLDGFFDPDQLVFVEILNICGVLALCLGLLVPGFRRRSRFALSPPELPRRAATRLMVGGSIVGSIGLACWVVTIVNVGGFTNAFSHSYAGGWDDNGYVRDGTLLMLAGVLLIIAGGGSKIRPSQIALTAVFALPWITQAILTSRRGPTFAVVTVLTMGWYLTRNRRPLFFSVFFGGIVVGYLVLFLVTNRNNIHLGSDFDLKTDVSDVVEKPDTGNEFIYGTGSVMASERRDHFFWGKRYLAQIMVRPIPSSVWPTKYEDFGVPELLANAGTGDGIGDVMGWQAAIGAAPGIIADTWVEFHWLNLPFLFLLGCAYGFTWRRAATRGGPWNAQYAILSSLSIYLVMQTMEAVIFRTLLLSIPSWIVWKWALRAAQDETRAFDQRSGATSLPMRTFDEEESSIYAG